MHWLKDMKNDPGIKIEISEETNNTTDKTGLKI